VGGFLLTSKYLRKLYLFAFPNQILRSANYYAGDSPNAHKHIKECHKVLRIQRRLSKLHFTLDTLKDVENKLLLQTIRHFSSLSSLNVQFSGNEKTPQEIFLNNLHSLKHLNQLDISFLFLTLDDAKILKDLMKIIRKLRRISSLSLTFLSCYYQTPLH